MNYEYLVTTSGGNDSVALMEFMYQKKCKFACVYNWTGWARPDWEARIALISKWCFDRGVQFFMTKPEKFENKHAKGFEPRDGFESLIAHNGGFPMPASKMQWCTMHLKETPTLKLLDKIDPDKELTIVTGRRREESQNRRDLAQYQDESEKHGGRDVWNPLYLHDEAKRDELIASSGFDVLPHSSMECYPCVCANSSDLASMSTDGYGLQVIWRLKQLEIALGHTRNGKPRVMFRPYRVGGGVGIESAVEWGNTYGWTAKEIPEEYRIKGVDYSAFKGRMKTDEKKAFWDNIKAQCVALGYDMKSLKSDIAYDDTTREGVQFARQCDGGYCGS